MDNFIAISLVSSQGPDKKDRCAINRALNLFAHSRLQVIKLFILQTSQAFTDSKTNLNSLIPDESLN